MEPTAALAAKGGVAHSIVLSRMGVPDRALSRAVATGEIERLRRKWYAGETAAVATARAVREGGHLACVSAAEERGLWVLPDGCLHVQVPPTASRLGRSEPDSDEPRLRFHYSTPRASSPVSPIESLDDMLIHVAACQSYEAAMCIFDSAQNRGLIDRHRLRELGEVMGGRFLDLVLASTGLADSGLETLTRIRLAALGITMTPQVVVDGHKADGRIGERMYLQLDGLAPHSSREQREKDLYEDARLRLGGHTVFRFLGSQVQEQWGFVQDTILGAITQGLHLWPASQRDRA